eukprot:CAMPEP_0173094924 /NCGR_PEP_ID=MMETSP1102-20130122/31461_1 /TAXON_ID=49646 /ORGANISM="Geminigera sp., Strain Caron Lab Isolate" /LENGTH=159 /DNA_ID=CAMNT_0013984395 /DNA_START=176 /DNA_END=655 /DNA_ORIENTATION=-
MGAKSLQRLQDKAEDTNEARTQAAHRAYVSEGMDFGRSAQVHWLPPASTGQSNITHYLMSRDDGLTWKMVPGGGLVNTTTIRGLVREQKLQVTLRAVNKVGPGPTTKTSAYNRESVSHHQKMKADGANHLDWPMPLANPFKAPPMAKALAAGAVAVAAG